MIRGFHAQRIARGLLRLGDVFSFSGASGGPNIPGDTFDEPAPAAVVGIQTERGENIMTEGGLVIQPENQ